MVYVAVTECQAKLTQVFSYGIVYLHASWHERDMNRGQKARCDRPVLPLRTTHKVPVRVQEDVEDTKI